MTKSMIDAKAARRLTKAAWKKQASSNALKKFSIIKLSDVKMQPIRQEDFEVDWDKAIKFACKKRHEVRAGMGTYCTR